MKKIGLLIISAIVLAGCSTPEKRRLEPIERDLQTDGVTTMLFHSSLYYPQELSIKSDGYIVGIEKSPYEVISVPEDIKITEIKNSGLDESKARDKIVGRKILYISHIIKTEEKQGGIGNCSIYNAYNQSKFQEIEQITPQCPNDSLNQPIPEKSAFKSSWRALDQLERSIKDRISRQKYTDIIVVTMGWNTVQEEAVRNFNSIIGNMKISAKKDFKPLVIGVTWPSQWQSRWIEPIYQFFSFPVKASDADELGMTWLGVLLHKTIPNANRELPVTVVGHSFGSRASSFAACVGPVIYEDTPNTKKSKIANLINLQGAFLSARLFGQDDRGIHYPENCGNVRKIFLTASKHDRAMNSAIWGVYAGDERSYKIHCKADSGINCVKAGNTGRIADVVISNPASNITYVDADDLIKENAYLSGGGAHSDIYRKEHGVLINSMISNLSE